MFNRRTDYKTFSLLYVGTERLSYVSKGFALSKIKGKVRRKTPIIKFFLNISLIPWTSFIIEFLNPLWQRKSNWTNFHFKNIFKCLKIRFLHAGERRGKFVLTSRQLVTRGLEVINVLLYKICRSRVREAINVTLVEHFTRKGPRRLGP